MTCVYRIGNTVAPWGQFVVYRNDSTGSFSFRWFRSRN